MMVLRMFSGKTYLNKLRRALNQFYQYHQIASADNKLTKYSTKCFKEKIEILRTSRSISILKTCTLTQGPLKFRILIPPLVTGKNPYLPTES